jgi:hypothetical protein
MVAPFHHDMARNAQQVRLRIAHFAQVTR